MDGKRWLAAALATALGAATYACGDSGDGGGTSSGPSPNEAPSATISAPADSSERSTTETVVLEGGASDPEEGQLSGSSLVWSSDRDGELGTSERVEVEGLSVGAHDITLTATDSEGAEATDEVTVSLARPIGTGDSINGVSGDEDQRKFYQVDLQASARQDVEPGQSGGADVTVPNPTPTRDTVDLRSSDGNQVGPPERQAPKANVDSGDADPSAAAAAAESQTFTVQLSGGTGNADLYLRLGDAPTPSTFDCRSSGPDNDEACRIEDPRDGTWYVLVHGASSFSGVTLSVPGATSDGGTGRLEVSASTTGENPDPDGYTVTVDPDSDGASSQSIGTDATVTFEGLAEGDHVVELSGVANNCSVEGENPRTVSVPNGGSTSTGFDVTCSDVPGDLEVTASTTGEDLDPDGYTVTVDPGTSSERTASIGPNGSTTFTDLSSEDHQVELSGIASNCSVDGNNPRTVTVPAGGTASTGFSVGCSATTGALEASVSTSGEDPDPDGYTVALTGPEDRSQSVDPNGTVTFGDLPEGDYEVDLQGLADNCEVTDGTPKTATVTAGSTASVSFSVDCPAPLEIATSSPLPEATEDSAYSEQLEATGGSGTGYTWRVVSGSLPTGMTLSLDGAISGEPASDDATFTVEVEDSEGATTQKSFDLPVNMKPDVTIERPQDGLKAGQENVITFEGSADDPEGTSIVAYEWFRSEDGTPVSLGTGRIIETTLPAGSHTIWLDVEAADGLEATSETITVEIADTDPSQYDVGFRFASDVPASIRDGMRAAAPAWEAVVVGDEPAYWVNDADGLGCVPPMDEVVDDLLVFVEMDDIDGDGGVVARAGPRHIRSSSDGRFPITGCITVDTADTDLADGDLQGVMEHELGHVLGIPFLWNDRGLVSGSGTDDPIFTGPEAEQAFLDVGGDTYSGDPVPLEAGDEAHWRESVFASELMTPTFVADGNTEPLSRVTGASLADVGYEVDLGGTDPYTLGQSAVRIEGEEAQTLDFSGDLLPGPVTELDPPGGGDR